jgi:hypothetical protein
MEMGIIRIFRETQIASNDVLEQSHTGVSDQGRNHIAQNVRYSKEALGCLADVIETGFIN